VRERERENLGAVPNIGEDNKVFYRIKIPMDPCHPMLLKQDTVKRKRKI